VRHAPAGGPGGARRPARPPRSGGCAYGRPHPCWPFEGLATLSGVDPSTSAGAWAGEWRLLNGTAPPRGTDVLGSIVGRALRPER
jgi:hypothetical protein